ncbi:MAG: EF-Tu/IF-2/RF-3 family GTPase, partial [bacterium]|nr:EF-Tu/IF-2/RF-3 family GTPase [bacterium]
KPARFQPFNLAYDNFLGRLAVGRIYEGKVKLGMTLTVKHPDKNPWIGKVTKLYTFEGTTRTEVKEALSGDIAMVAGFKDIFIGDTLCEDPESVPLPAIAVDEPTISLNFLVNDSPFAGRDGKFVTGRQVRERLEKELEINVGLKVDFSAGDFFKVFGRGELHVAVLLENMRREGYELQVSEPQVITKEHDGIILEPFEEAIIDAPHEFSGEIISKLSMRKGVLTGHKEIGSRSRLVFEIPTRGLLGFRNEFIVNTKGEGLLSSRFVAFKEYAGNIKRHSFGSMVSMASGKALAFSLWNLQERGALYIAPGEDVYEGMIIGNVTKGDDLDVNPTKGKQLSNVRASGSDEAIMLVPPLSLSIERGLETMSIDDYLEITPKNIRLRKKYLTKAERGKNKRIITQ